MIDKNLITWKIEKEITKKLSKRDKINNRLIYIADIYCEIIYKSELKKKESQRRKEIIILKDQLYESKPSKENKEYFLKECLRKCDLEKTKQMEIKKIVLKKELGCSIYE